MHSLKYLTPIERVLQTYSLEDILELNELTEAEALTFLVEQQFVSLPNPEPVDYDTSE